MKASQLRQLLDYNAGGEQLEFRIPLIFLPPRFRKLSKERDLLLVLDEYFTINVRWQDEDFHTHHPLTPGESRRLVGEVMKYMKKYRENLRVFGKFLNEWSEPTWDKERYHDGIRQEKEVTQRAKKARSEEEDEHEAKGQEEEQEIASSLQAILQETDELVEVISSERGGESPCPSAEY